MIINNKHFGLPHLWTSLWTSVSLAPFLLVWVRCFDLSFPTLRSLSLWGEIARSTPQQRKPDLSPNGGTIGIDLSSCWDAQSCLHLNLIFWRVALSGHRRYTPIAEIQFADYVFPASARWISPGSIQWLQASNQRVSDCIGKSRSKIGHFCVFWQCFAPAELHAAITLANHSVGCSPGSDIGFCLFGSIWKLLYNCWSDCITLVLKVLGKFGRLMG